MKIFFDKIKICVIIYVKKEAFCMDVLEFNSNECLIYEKLKSTPKVLEYLDTNEIYSVICLALHNENIKKVIIENKKIIINKLILDFNLFDSMSFYNLKTIPEFNNEVNYIISETFDKVFQKETIFFIRMANHEFIKNNVIAKNEIFNLIFAKLRSLDNDKAATILFDLRLLPDFKTELKRRYGLVELLMSKYLVYDPDLLYLGRFTGSSIIGLLIKDDNQYILADYIDELLKKYKKRMNTIKCIGGGCSNLVYKIGDSVIKIGETRNSRKIFVNHRILASQTRKMVKNNGEDCFFIEIMKFIKTGNVTKAECLELQEDLLRQGIIWEDVKPENCGILDKDDENVSYLPLDYVDVAAIIDNPIDRQEFQKRKRKVVVLDNDNMRLNPKALWK